MSKKTLLEDMFVLPQGSPKTFSYDETLPSLPVPSLRHSLDRYVESVQPFVTASELANTKRLVKEFEQGMGKDLQAKLLKKAATERNWVSVLSHLPTIYNSSQILQGLLFRVLY